MPALRSKRYIIVYDVTDDGKRARLANLLLDYGTRVQKSVFEANLSLEMLQKMLGLAVKYISEEDSLRVYPQCKSCAEAEEFFGRKVNTASDSLRIV